MPSLSLRISLKRLLVFIAASVVIYLMIGRSVMPSRSKVNHPRDLLSVKQKQQLIAENPPKNEEIVEALVQSNSEGLKERMRSPDPAVAHDNGSDSLSVSLAAALKRVENSDAKRMKLSSSKLCPDISDNPYLEGQLHQAVLLITNLKEADVLAHHPYLQPGGHWKPSNCIARYKVALIIPFRDRQSHLTRLIDFLIPLLKKQLLDFRFIVTEQFGQGLFNKGRIMNAAFRLAERLDVDCVIFHDVDMFPQDDRNSYGCPDSPRHVGAFVSNLGYQLWYKEIVGGVLAITMSDYRTINGYSNMYWAWGGEDDDMGKRILSLNMTIERPDVKVGRFSMLKHVKRKRIAPKLIYKLLEDSETRWPKDGLNVTSWKVVKEVITPLYYHIYVNVGNPPSDWTDDKNESQLLKVLRQKYLRGRDTKA